MGSIATLSIENLEIASSKNYILNFSILFSALDKIKANTFYKIQDTEDLEYYVDDYFIYMRKLKDLCQRLNLIGFTKENLYIKYNNYLLDYITENNADLEFLSLDFFISYLKTIDLINIEFISDISLSGQSSLSRNFYFFLKNNFPEIFKKYESYFYEVSEFIDQINPFLLLSFYVFYELAPESNLIWDYYHVFNNGYHDEGGFTDISNNPPFFLITEGSSDSTIIKIALDWIYPDIAGFFEFIDMKENYPFTGVGNIVNFYHGICKIGVHRNIIILFDNDSAGEDAIRRCINPPLNISLIKLPVLESFRKFATIGPNGKNLEDINGKAVAIECFLDLNYKSYNTPLVRWISYFEKLDRYQGALIHKEKYMKLFIEAKKKNDSNYSTENLIKLLDYIISIASMFHETINYDA